MNNTLISVIVPVYNVERYLPRCIESILKQTYKNFELILVDDGTPDRSGIICDRYAEKDSRIKVIHKENGGVSTARNAGIDAAKGEWITFVDSDDWIEEKYLNMLLEPAIKSGLDLVVGTVQHRDLTIFSFPIHDEIVDVNQTEKIHIVKAISRQEFGGPCVKLFKASIIQDNNIRFISGIKIGEDAIFVKQYLRYSKRFALISGTIYYYNRLNDKSVTYTPQFLDKRAEWIDEHLKSDSVLLDVYGVKDPQKSEILTRKAIDKIKGFITLSLNVACLRDAKYEIARMLTILDKWVLVFECTNEKEKLFVEAIMRKNVDLLCKMCQTNSLFGNIKRRTKALVKKILRTTIEKKRDNLILFKNDMCMRG